MKAQRPLMIVIASLVLSLLSLSVTFTVTSSSRPAPPDERSIVLTVRVVDTRSEIVSSAHVIIYQGNIKLGEGDSNPKGLAQMRIAVNTDRAVELVIEVSKPGMETNPYILKLGTAFPDRPPVAEITLKPAANTEQFLLTVKAVDKDGNGIKLAHVNIYLGSYIFGTDTYVRPPTFQQDTNADGRRDFEIPVKIGQDVDVTIELSREDMQTMRRTVTLRTGLLTLDQLETFVLSPRTEAASEVPSVNINVNVEDDAGNNLEGALVKLDSSALTPSLHNTPHQRNTGPDGSATVAIELMSADSVEHIGLTVSKRGYKEFKKVIDVKGREAGTTVQVGMISLVKLAKAEGARSVTVKVRDADQPNTPVADATVVLDSKLATGYYPSVTNASGEATFEVKETGGFAVRISQDNYEPLKDGEVRLGKDEDSKTAEFFLKAKPKKDMAGDLIEVTVLAKASVDDRQPKPLPGANISDGRGVSVITDENGRATLRGAYDMPQPITVTAKDYKPKTQRVAAARVLTLNGKGSATFVLDPELTDSSPIRLIVEVRDAADTNKKLDAANVLLRFKGKIIGGENTDANGETPAFNLRDSADLPLSKLRSGLRVDVQRDKYKIKWSDITPDRLEPSLEARRVTIFLERDTDDIRKAVEALEPRVFAWNNDSRADTTGATKAFIDKALIARQEAQALANEITAGVAGIVAAAGGHSLCAQAAPFLLNIRSAEAKVNQKAAQIETTLKNASAAAGSCSSTAQAESLRATYRKAIQTLAEIGTLNKQAAKDHEELTAIAQKNLAAKDIIAQLRQKLANIERLQNVAAENASSAAALYGRTADRSKTIISRQLTLKAELAVLTVKVEAETGVPNDLLKRISTMEQILGSTNTSLSYGTQAEQALPQSVRDAAAAIGDISRTAEAKISEVDGWPCNVATLDDAVNGINTTFTNAQFDIGLAADLPKQADDCVAKATQQTNTDSSVKTSTGSDTTENKPDDKVSTSTGPSKDKKPSTVEDDPGIKIAQPSKPNSQDTSSGGFWESAKAGKKKVENAVNNKPANPTNPATTGETSDDNRGTNTAAIKPASKGSKPSSSVEEIPEDRPSTNIAANKPGSKSVNKPPAVEEIPETRTGNGTGSSKRPAKNPSTGVEEIPETAVKPAAARGSVDTSDTEPAKSGNKKPKDPNKPSKWQKAGAILGAIAAAANNQNQGTNNPGTTNTGTTNTGTTGAASGGNGKEWMIRNEYRVDLIRIAVRNGQVVWADKQEVPARQGCVRDPALFSGSFDGKKLALDWTINAEFCPSDGKYYSTRVRFTVALALNSDGSLNGTYTTYATDWGDVFDRRTLTAKPPTTAKADGICIKCQ